jgi:hypothetical protein
MNKTSKIGSLPDVLRDQINQLLHDGEPGPRLLRWLNGIPDVRKFLKREFNGVPISKQNLSEWRNGGYRRWRVAGEMEDYAHECCARHEEWDQNFESSTLASHLATALSCRYAKFFATWDGQPTPQVEAELRVLRGLNKDIALLHKTMELAYEHKNKRASDVKERMADRVKAPMMAMWRAEALAGTMGNAPWAKKLAEIVAAAEYDLPQPEYDIEKLTAESEAYKAQKEAAAKSTVKNNSEQTEPEEVSPKPSRPARVKSVKPVKAVKEVKPVQPLEPAEPEPDPSTPDYPPSIMETTSVSTDHTASAAT